MTLRRAATLLACVIPAVASAADVGRGSEIYRQHCVNCHGPNGRPVLAGAPDFSRPMALAKPESVLVTTIRSGRGAMPGFSGLLREREMLDVVAHLRTLR
jgi:cytochrome c6